MDYLLRVIADLETAGRKPHTVWRCPRGCVLLRVWRLPENRLAVWQPGGRMTTPLGRQYGHAGQPIPSDTIARFPASAIELDHFVAKSKSGILRCRHYEFLLMEFGAMLSADVSQDVRNRRISESDEEPDRVLRIEGEVWRIGAPPSGNNTRDTTE